MHFIFFDEDLRIYKSLEISCVAFVGSEVNEVTFEEIKLSVSLKVGKSIEMSDQSSVVVVVEVVPADLPRGVNYKKKS